MLPAIVLWAILVTSCDANACVTTYHDLGAANRADADRAAETIRQQGAKVDVIPARK